MVLVEQFEQSWCFFEIKPPDYDDVSNNTITSMQIRKGTGTVQFYV